MPPPDYWPDARRLPADKLRTFVEVVRGVRRSLGLSNAELCRETHALIEAHNGVPGREPVHLKALSGDWEYREQGKYELGAIRKGTRKYIVGYLAWLCLRDEDAARALYDELDLTFRPYTEDDTSDESTPATRAKSDALAEASSKELFLVYEIAFLWFGVAPPPAAIHQNAMTPEIAQMKNFLHKAIDLGQLDGLHIQAPGGGYSRIVQKDELQRFAQEIEVFPQFLFPDLEPPSPGTSARIAELIAELDELLVNLPLPVTDWAQEYDRNDWAIYEAAFLWHGFVPPPSSLHDQVMPELVQQTKQMLHDAANANELTPAVDEGMRMRNVMVNGTRHVTRPELRRFATSIGQRPRFLFPEGDE